MNSHRVVAICSFATILMLSASLAAQDNQPPAGGAAPPRPPTEQRRDERGRGRFDPAEFQKRIMDGVKERLGFKDEEWVAVQPLVQKVFDLRRETLTSGFSGFRFGSRSSSSRGGSEGSRSPWFTPSPEAEALQKAIDDNAPAAQVKGALERFRAAKKEKEAQLAAAQEELRKVLTARQEALATLMGLLP